MNAGSPGTKSLIQVRDELIEALADGSAGPKDVAKAVRALEAAVAEINELCDYLERLQ